MSQAGSAGVRGVGAGRAGPTLAQLGHRRASWGQREIAILYRGAAAGVFRAQLGEGQRAPLDTFRPGMGPSSPPAQHWWPGQEPDRPGAQFA